MTTADVSVRIAWPDDAEAIARVQVSGWAQMYAGLLPPESLPDDPAPVADAWRRALTAPGDARNRVLVALERASVRGFAVTQPAGDPDSDPVADSELVELTVHPEARGVGHGSRLLQAAVDTVRADRFRRLACWVVAADDERRAFLTGSGWAADGAHRELDWSGDGTTTVRQVRLHTALV
jgi:ribosomal protein S18 acetylase RimI-like enzyme